MDVTRLKRELLSALKELKRQRNELDGQISGVENALNSLSGGRARSKSSGGGSSSTRKKPHWSPEARKAAADRMKKYWAGQKKPAGAEKKRKKTSTSKAKSE